MRFLISLLLLASGVGPGEAAHWQKLKCPYEQNHVSLPRVWCRRSSAECCSGLAFSWDARSADGGKLEVSEDSHSFTVELLEPSHREGVYWCGVLGRNNTVIKLAEGYVYCSTGSYIWAHARWILLCLLPTVTTFTCMYARRITRHHSQKAEEPYDDVAVPGSLTAPRYENAASSLLQE
ncbi:uncharacterized protein si:ch211-102c2.4 [Acanthochromis polyacanthus]|uniref:uncharacterized protein si:ch211-102c2.4 n=1 Tax=Acanthochromis polyacanthus TaxID=80966 RepID=UPI0022344DCA|nr:uncharacterized protein si:ch211-102c2.4 [Acanthochromis polyacanthus]